MADKDRKYLNGIVYFPCEAIQQSDQMQCVRCSLTWDINDSEPPKCMRGKDLFNRARDKLKRVIP